MKEKVRVLAVDDAPFRRGVDKHTFLVALLFRGFILERALKERIEVDGSDSAEALIRLCNHPKVREEVRVIMTHGTTFGGLNVLNVNEVYEELRTPLIACVSKRPENIERALRSAGFVDKINIVRLNPPYRPVKTNFGTVYCSWIGLIDDEAIKLVRSLTVESKIPEPLRVADIVASLLSDI